jgi:hypothetical protein
MQHQAQLALVMLPPLHNAYTPHSFANFADQGKKLKSIPLFPYALKEKWHGRAIKLLLEKSTKFITSCS